LDLEIREATEQVPLERVAPRRSTGVWIAACLFLVAAAAAVYVAFRARVPDLAPAPTAPRAVAATKPLGGDAPAITLPPLDQSDGVVADLVRKLSSHPQVAAWLTTNGLIRNFTVVVSNIADGNTPAKLLPPLRPRGPFEVIEQGGGVYADPRSYERYRPLADAVASIDAKGSASLYATLKPRIEEAHRELGQVDASFDRTLERAIVLLLETPVRSAPARLRPHGIGYAFASPADENLSPAQKQLLRMGPEHARAVQAKLREIALALGVPSERLPR
jgi:hypothetical protein